MNKWKIVFLSILAIIAISLLSVYLIPREKADEAGMITVCSDIIKERMKSPSSYSLRNVILTTDDASESQLEKKLENKFSYFRKYIENGSLVYRVSDVFIEYEAKNEYGVLLKNNGHCRYDVFSLSQRSFYFLEKIKISDDEYMSDLSVMILGREDSTIGEGGFMRRIDYLKLKFEDKVN